MQNQDSSPPGAELTGVTGPIAQSFDSFFAQFIQTSMSVEAKHNLRLTWYLSSLFVYNTLMTCTRQPAPILQMMTEAMKKDLDDYFATEPMPVAAGELTPQGHNQH